MNKASEKMSPLERVWLFLAGIVGFCVGLSALTGLARWVGWEIEWWLFGSIAFAMLCLALLVLGSIGAMIIALNGGDLDD